MPSRTYQESHLATNVIANCILGLSLFYIKALLTYNRVMQSDPSLARFLSIPNCSLYPSPTGHMVSIIGYTQLKRTVSRSMLLQVISLDQYGYTKSLLLINCLSEFLKYSYDGLLVSSQCVYLKLMLPASYFPCTK